MRGQLSFGFGGREVLGRVLISEHDELVRLAGDQHYLGQVFGEQIVRILPGLGIAIEIPLLDADGEADDRLAVAPFSCRRMAALTVPAR